jgi:hypothetical protein
MPDKTIKVLVMWGPWNNAQITPTQNLEWSKEKDAQNSFYMYYPHIVLNVQQNRRAAPLKHHEQDNPYDGPNHVGQLPSLAS